MASDIPVSPDFIKFLFSTKPKFDCYFIVGNKSQQVPERIGAVKLMLMAHSEVLRLELEDSDLSEKGDVKVEDINPDTFRGMLKYVYGHDTIAELCFDDADNMLYVAEKYMINTLKDKLAVRLMELLNPKNICSLLNNPACYKHLELNCAMTEILRFETNRVLESPQFLEMNTEGFLKILEQDGLAVPEIELWRAAMKWAKHRVKSEDEKILRHFSSVTKHLRLCTLVPEEIIEVASMDVLTANEVGIVCQSLAKKTEPEDLNGFSKEIVPRKKLDTKMKPKIQRVLSSFMNPTKIQKNCELTLKVSHSIDVDRRDYTFTICTQKCAIELLPLVCFPNDHFYINCTAIVTKEENSNCSVNEPPITVEYRNKMNTFEVPLTVEKSNVILLPESKYTIIVKLNTPHLSFTSGIRKDPVPVNRQLTPVIVQHAPSVGQPVPSVGRHAPSLGRHAPSVGRYAPSRRRHAPSFGQPTLSFGLPAPLSGYIQSKESIYTYTNEHLTLEFLSENYFPSEMLQYRVNVEK